jgi:DNA-binding transcriptional regulator LsrR (DeoR family)
MGAGFGARRCVVVESGSSGMSLTNVAKSHNISRASVCRLVKESRNNSAPAVVASDENLVA